MATPGLIERDDTILLVIDIQDFFLKKIDPVRVAALVDNCRFLVEAANQLDIPTFVTVEDPGRNGWTTQAVRERLAPGTPERDKSGPTQAHRRPDRFGDRRLRPAFRCRLAGRRLPVGDRRRRRRLTGH